MELKHFEMAGLLIASHIRGALARGLLDEEKLLDEDQTLGRAKKVLTRAQLDLPEDATFKQELALLEATGIVERIEENRAHYRLTEKGRRAALAAFPE